MLVLSRRANESLLLGPDDTQLIEISVIEIRGDKVRLGIQIPREWVIHRKEIYETPRQTPPESPGS
ncbi:MAG: carbon storage regulator [Planctomycetota bacterium]|nr:MAG: carbon storage regulator [Planctomycetota bacterium]